MSSGWERLALLPLVAADRDRPLQLLRRRHLDGDVVARCRESLLRKMSFPRLIIPTAATLTAVITLGVNASVVIFLACDGIMPQPTGS